MRACLLILTVVALVRCIDGLASIGVRASVSTRGQLNHLRMSASERTYIMIKPDGVQVRATDMLRTSLNP
jgi:hypothetical protein